MCCCRNTLKSYSCTLGRLKSSPLFWFLCLRKRAKESKPALESPVMVRVEFCYTQQHIKSFSVSGGILYMKYQGDRQKRWNSDKAAGSLFWTATANYFRWEGQGRERSCLKSHLPNLWISSSWQETAESLGITRKYLGPTSKFHMKGSFPLPFKTT